MKAACLIMAALAVGASAAATVAPARQEGGGGGRRPATCPTQQCVVAAGGTCGTSPCIQCFPTFSSGSDADPSDAMQCAISCTIENCFRCNISNPGQCTECANDGTNPFYLNAAGVCLACTAQNCAARGWDRRNAPGGCRTDGFCKKCARGFGRAADQSCVACDSPQGVENCAVCSQDDASICFKCKAGLYWDATTKACVPCDPDRVSFAGCANCPAVGVCRECLPGYAAARGARSRARSVTCTACPDGCARCDAGGKCSACLPPVTEGGQTSFWVFDFVSRACYGPFVTGA